MPVMKFNKGVRVAYIGHDTSMLKYSEGVLLDVVDRMGAVAVVRMDDTKEVYEAPLKQWMRAVESDEARKQTDLLEKIHNGVKQMNYSMMYGAKLDSGMKITGSEVMVSGRIPSTVSKSKIVKAEDMRIGDVFHWDGEKVVRIDHSLDSNGKPQVTYYRSDDKFRTVSYGTEMAVR